MHSEGAIRLQLWSLTIIKHVLNYGHCTSVHCRYGGVDRIAYVMGQRQGGGVGAVVLVDLLAYMHTQ